MVVVVVVVVAVGGDGGGCCWWWWLLLVVVVKHMTPLEGQDPPQQGPTANCRFATGASGLVCFGRADDV